MRHMNSKLVKLLHEGFSMTTLENLNEKQLNVLYRKITEDKGSVRMPADKADPAKLKALTDQGINVEMSEDMEDPMDFEKGQRTQDPKQVGPNTDDGQDEYGDGMPAESSLQEKAVSKQQQKIMGLALSVKKGDTPKSKVSKSVQKMAKEMSKKELEDFASTKHKGLPKTVDEKEEVEKLEESILRIIENHLPPHTTKGELLNYIRRNA